MASHSSSARKLGSNVVMFGLIVQLLIFGFFVVVAAVFHLRLTRTPTSKAYIERHMTHDQGWRRRNWITVLLALYAVSALILVRCVYRLIEYKSGFDSYLMVHEVFMYLFDALLMFIAMVVMNIYHPADVLGDGKSHEMLDQDAVPL